MFLEVPEFMDDSLENKSAKTTVLVVDDETTHRLSLQAILEEKGYYCEGADNGGEAISILKETTIDLLLTDFNLPIMNGIQLIEHINQRDLLFHPPSILITGQLDDTIAKRAQEAGAIATIRKPYNISELLSLMSKALQNQRDATNSSLPQKVD